jgi:hypothetical protein
MKPVFNVELLFNENNKMVYVYKIEQNNFPKKNTDSRDIIRRMFINLFKEVKNKNCEIYFYSEEILIDKMFKVFVFLICDEEQIKIVNEIFSTEKFLFVRKINLKKFLVC